MMFARSLALFLLPSGAFAQMATCGQMKKFYKSSSCCGNPDKVLGNLSATGLVTRDMVVAAQKEWGDGIVKIAAAKTSGGDFEKAAHDHIMELYAYGHGSVLFKPTLAAEQQFRSTLEGALSYFVATNNHAGEDKGFAIKGWTAVRFVNEEIIVSGNMAMAMGNYFFTTPEGSEVKVEYSFGYVLDAMGKLRINLHHSSMPYSNAVAKPFTCTSTVTKAMVEAAQKEWGDGIVAIAAAKTSNGDYGKVATDLVNKLYAYGHGEVLFKPTLAAMDQFRETLEGAMSYFVAQNGFAPEDKGFAIKGWTAVKFENEDIIVSGSTAMAMGNYHFTGVGGKVTKVEYTFGYVLDKDGKLRINLHHSSLPYEQVTAVTGCATTVTKAMIETAQATWGAGIVAISTAYTATPQQNYTQVAVDLVTDLYAYGQTPVLFKPTLAAEIQFRDTFEEALSYFVATSHVKEDTGFAIKGWTAVRFVNEEIIIAGTAAVAMGNYFFTKADGTVTKVEYSFGYVLDTMNKLRINLHHSSLPYSP